MMKIPDIPSGIGRGHQEIVAEIQAMIRREALNPGDRMPSERTLAAGFRVSRNSVREAIRTLTEKGVLTSRRGDGTYIASNDINDLVAGLAEVLQVQRRRLREIFDFRRLLEPEIVARAAVCIQPEDLDFLKLTVFEQERRLMSGADDSEQDRAFHQRLARITGSRVLQDVMKILESIIDESRSKFLKNSRRQRLSIQAHIRIIDALERGSGPDARQLMIAHLNEVEAAVFVE